MKKKTFYCLVSVLLLMAIFSGCRREGTATTDAAPHRANRVYSMATATLGGAYYVIGAGLSETLTQAIPYMTVNAIIAPGSTGNPILVGTGEADLGITSYFAASNALEGTGPYDRSFELSGVCSLQIGLLHIMVMGNRTELNSIADLRGQRVNFGPAGGGGALILNNIIDLWGLTLDDINISYLGFNEGTDALRDRRLDVNVVNSAYPAEAISSAASLDNVRLIGIDTERMRQFTQRIPLYDIGIIPAGTYRGIDVDTQTVASNEILIVRSDMDPDEVYDIISAIYDNLDFLRTVHPSMGPMRLEGYKHSLVPLHPGALRFFQERGIRLE